GANVCGAAGPPGARPPAGSPSRPADPAGGTARSGPDAAARPGTSRTLGPTARRGPDAPARSAAAAALRAAPGPWPTVGGWPVGGCRSPIISVGRSRRPGTGPDLGAPRYAGSRGAAGGGPGSRTPRGPAARARGGGAARAFGGA